MTVSTEAERRGRAGTTAAAPGAEGQAFAPNDWGLVATVVLLWGASFLFIEIGLDHLSPPVVAFLRVFSGAATLALLPGARRARPRSEGRVLARLGLIWIAIPFVLFAVAQQWISRRWRR